MSSAEEPACCRAPASGEGWSEMFLSAVEKTCSASEGVALGHSILILHDLATAVECETLRAEASSLAAAERAAVDLTRPEKIRLPVLEKLSEAGLALYDALLLRSCARVDECLPELIPRLFEAGCLDTSTCLRNERLMFSLGEPAINIYQAGGSFKAHQDKQSLTVLMPLSNPDAFGGGGTAFWASEQPLPEYGGSGVDGTLRGPPPALDIRVSQPVQTCA